MGHIWITWWIVTSECHIGHIWVKYGSHNSHRAGYRWITYGKTCTEVRRSCHGTMHDTDILFRMLRQITHQSRCAEHCHALTDWQPMDRVVHRAEADRATPHNLRACLHLRITSSIGCLSTVRCASVFPALRMSHRWVTCGSTIVTYGSQLNYGMDYRWIIYESKSFVYTSTRNGSRTKCAYVWTGLWTCAAPSANGLHNVHHEPKFVDFWRQHKENWMHRRPFHAPGILCSPQVRGK